MKTKNKKQKQLSLVPKENLVVSHHTYHCKSTRSSFIGPKYRDKNTTESFCRSLSLSLLTWLVLLNQEIMWSQQSGPRDNKMWGQYIYKSGPTFGLGPLPSPDRIRRLVMVWEWEIIKSSMSIFQNESVFQINLVMLIFLHFAKCGPISMQS